MMDDFGGGQQIPLAFSKFEQIDFDLYEAGQNQVALMHLQALPSAQDKKNIYLWGACGTGKSHLLQAVCTAAAKTRSSIAYIPLSQADLLSPEMLDGLEFLELVCLDDLDAIAGNSDWEQAIFHLYNRSRETQSPLLMTAGYSPLGSPIQLADLKSRLAWDHVFHLLPLDDNEALIALKKRAHSRGFELPADVADFLLRRVARDMHNLFAILEQLDKASLIAKKKLTIPFLKDLLD